MQRGWRYSIAGAIAAISTVALCAALDYINNREGAARTDKINAIPVAYFDCNFGYWPDVKRLPQNAALFFRVIQWSDRPELTLAVSGGPIINDNHNKPFSSVAPLKCEITFHNEKPMFNVQVPFTIEIFENIHSVNSNARGHRINKIEASFNLQQVYVPDKKTFSFYIYSFNVDAWVGVINHNIFTFSNDADQTRVEGKLINNSSITFISVGPAP